MNTRIMAGAFLTYQNKVLLLKRSMNKKLAPGLWSCTGGHLEHEEVENPRQLNHKAAIYREIEEETGISQNDILTLDLRYIITRVSREEENQEIHLVYYYTVKLTREFEPPFCDEGVFHWVDMNDKQNIFDLPMSFSVKEIVKHWLNNPDDKNIYLVGINKDNNKSVFTEV